MNGTGMNGMGMTGRGRLDWSEEYRLAHNLLKIVEIIAILRPCPGGGFLVEFGGLKNAN